MKLSKLIVAAMLFSTSPESLLAQDGAARRLFDALDGPAFTEQGGLWYKENDEQSAGRLNFRAPVGPGGAPALELLVQPNCRPDSRGCSERAEIWEKEDLLLPYEAVVWYGFSMKLMDPIPQDDHRYVMAQWKRSIVPGATLDYSPYLALRLRRGAMYVTTESDEIPIVDRGSRCRPDAARAVNRPGSGQTRIFVVEEEGADGANAQGYTACAPAVSVTSRGGRFPTASSGWNDFVFGVKTGARGGGRIEIFANGQWIASVRGHIGHQGEGLGPHQYFKFGPYRAARDGVWSVAYSQFRRGSVCADVAGREVCKAMESDPLK